jgi:ADP-heptose:LPS heptosyltransferase
VTNDGKGLDYFVAPEEEVTPPYPSYLAFVIGAAHATKRLEEEQMVELCSQIDYPIVLLGGPSEKEMGGRIAAAGKNIFNACGKYSLNGSADLVRKAAAVITHDTGLMHIAAAYRKRIISVWGNTVPAFGMYPYLPQGPDHVMAQVGGLKCRPCSKIGHAECPKGHFKCMREQDLGAIARAALLAVEA